MKQIHFAGFSASLLLFTSFTLLSCSGNDDDPTGGKEKEEVNLNSNLNNPNKATHRLEFPKVKGGNSIILIHEAQLAYEDSRKRTKYEHGINYSVEWDTSKKSQRWSCYQMYANNSATNTKRYYADTYNGEVQYPQDPALASPYRFETDPFWRTGFDHGHICPSADRLCSREANIQTFYLTNMQPQLNSFNAGVWENGESWLRSKNNNTFRDTLYIAKGGTIDNGSQIKQRLSSGLIVPRYFFVAALAKKGNNYMAIGLWFEHKSDNNSISLAYVRNIDELEELTGIDFFCNLPDDIENRIESLPRENVARVWGIN